MNIFPFTIHNVQSETWFRLWIRENLEKLAQDYGNYSYTGFKERDSKKHFRYYEADVEFTSPSEMIVSLYDMASTVYGGRGELICTIPRTPDVQVVQQLIEQRILKLTAEEYDRREVERLKKQREDGIAVLRQELFGKLKY